MRGFFRDYWRIRAIERGKVRAIVEELQGATTWRAHPRPDDAPLLVRLAYGMGRPVEEVLDAVRGDLAHASAAEVQEQDS